MAAVPRPKGWWLDSGRFWLVARPLTCFGRGSRHVSAHPGIAPNFYIQVHGLPALQQRNNEVPTGWVIIA